jgi:transcriptional regulator with XRE-family HTH domain
MIDYYERRSPNPTLDVMQKIAEALEISVVELLGEEATAVRTTKKTDRRAKCRRLLKKSHACRVRYKKKLSSS